MYLTQFTFVIVVLLLVAAYTEQTKILFLISTQEHPLVIRSIPAKIKLIAARIFFRRKFE